MSLLYIIFEHAVLLSFRRWYLRHKCRSFDVGI